MYFRDSGSLESTRLMHAWELPFQSYEAKSNLNVAKERCPLLSLVQAADGLAANLLENK